jgi:Na+-driven multidrug efflux pump
VFAGRINVEALNAAIGISSFINFITMIPNGISESVSISVGNSLGAKKPYKTFQVIKANLVFTGALGIALSIGVLIFRTFISEIYSNQLEVIELMRATLPCYAIYLTFDYS